MSSAPAPLEPVLGLTRDEGHTYTAWYPPAPPLILPSVTTALGILAKPALLNWYPKVAATWALDNVEGWLRAAVDDRNAAIALAASQGRLERDRRADLGTRAHQAVEAELAGLRPLLEPDAAALFEQWRLFRRDWQFRPIWSEAMVVGEGYAGTFDLYGELAGRRAMIDIKTGTYIGDEAPLQLAAYGSAAYIGRPGVTDRWAIPPIDLYAVLQLQPTYYRLIPYDVTDRERAAFRTALDLYQWSRQRGRRIAGQPLTKGALVIA